MDILYVVPYVPSLIRVRPYNLIRFLSARGHRLTVLTLYSSEVDLGDVEALKNCVQQVIALPLPLWRSLLSCLLTLSTSRPLQAGYCWQPRLAKELGDLVLDANGAARFDIVHVEHLRGARYGLYLHDLLSSKTLPGKRPALVWDSVDSITHLFRQASVHSRRRLNRWLTRIEMRRTEGFEGSLVEKFDRTLVTSTTDREAFIHSPQFRGDPGRISVLPNGVDLDYFHPKSFSEVDPAALVISGKMSYHANVSMALYFVREILPLIWQSRPEVKLRIVGKEPPAEIRRLSQDPRIEVTGTVSDLRPYLRQAALAVAPLTYGAGIQNKILEAMACATPVVTTPLAASALSAQPGREIVLAGTPEEFAKEVLTLLNDPSARTRLGENGRRYVEKYHNWLNIAGQLEGEYDEIIGELSGFYS